MTAEESSHNTEELDRIARGIARRGLTVPAIFLLELHKPLVGLGRLAAEAFDPLTRCLVGSGRAEAVLKMLESREALEYVMTRLEAIARQNRHGD